MPIDSTVAFLGPKGTFSHAAAITFFAAHETSSQTPWEMRSYSSIEDVFASVERGDVRFGVVPVENSTEGAVNNTQDCLLEAAVEIVGEIVIPIEHNLLAAPGAKLSSLTTIASHKQSLAQCRQWIAKHLPALTLKECVSNAQAAVLATKEEGVAAIAGEFAAQTYGLEVLVSSIQDHSHNSTRFLILSQPGQGLPDRANAGSSKLKTSILVATDNKPGALFRILEPFNALEIDLSKIEARPSKQRAWEYVFFIDFIRGGLDLSNDALIQNLMTKLREETSSLRVLGTYATARQPSASEGS